MSAIKRYLFGLDLIGVLWWRGISNRLEPHS